MTNGREEIRLPSIGKSQDGVLKEPKGNTLPRDGSKPTGFTLIELLVAMALFMMVAVILITATEGVTSLSSQATTRLESVRVGREALDAIGKDLSVAALPWAKGATNSLQLLVASANMPANFRNPHSIFWQAPIARNKAHGDLAMVGYFVLRDLESDPTKSRLQLRRLLVEPTAPESGKYSIYNTPAGWLTPELLEQFAPSTIELDNENAQKGWVADGILALWVRCLDREGNVISLKASGESSLYQYDSRASYRSSETNTYYYPNPSVLPSFLEVAVVCVAPSEVKKIKSLPPAAAVSPLQFNEEVKAFAEEARKENPGVKSIAILSRKIRIYGGY